MSGFQRHDFDVAIVGGGLIGLTTGYELLRRGRRVLVLEANDEVAMGASFANGGLLTLSMSDPWNAPGVMTHLARSLFDPKSAMRLRLRAVPGLWRWGLKFIRNASEKRYLSSTETSFQLAQYSTKLTRDVSRDLALSFDAADRGTLKLFRSAKAMAAPLRLARLLADAGLAFEVLDRDGVVKAER